MNAGLEQAVSDYLRVRRAAGFELVRAEKLLGQFTAYLAERGSGSVRTEDAVAWATLPADADPWWWAYRLSVVRGFAAWLHTLDNSAEVPPPGMIRSGPRRAVPYLYSDADVAALMAAAGELRDPLKSANYRTLIGLLAVTGMRVGEAIGLDRSDFDPANGLLTVREAKNAKTRLLPLHSTTVTALDAYQRQRDRLRPDTDSDALLISVTGKRLRYNTVWRDMHRLTATSGIAAQSPSRRPRIHDLRHTFAVTTLLGWYRDGADVAGLLPRLSTYLGHADPKHTYWYLSGAPELLALAAQRLDSAGRR